MSTTSFPCGAGEAILKRAPPCERDTCKLSRPDLGSPASTLQVQLTGISWEGGQARADDLSGLVRNWLQPPGHMEEWEEGKWLWRYPSNVICPVAFHHRSHLPVSAASFLHAGCHWACAQQQEKSWELLKWGAKACWASQLLLVITPQWPSQEDRTDRRELCFPTHLSWLIQGLSLHFWQWWESLSIFILRLSWNSLMLSMTTLN